MLVTENVSLREWDDLPAPASDKKHLSPGVTPMYVQYWECELLAEGGTPFRAEVRVYNFGGLSLSSSGRVSSCAGENNHLLTARPHRRWDDTDLASSIVSNHSRCIVMERSLHPISTQSSSFQPPECGASYVLDLG